MSVGELKWKAAITWYEAEVLKPGGGQVRDSMIGKSVAKAESILWALKAAGLKAVPIEDDGDGRLVPFSVARPPR